MIGPLDEYDKEFISLIEGLTSEEKGVIRACLASISSEKEMPFFLLPSASET